MPSTGIAGYQASFIGGVKLVQPPVAKNAEMLLRFRPGLMEKSLNVQWLEYMAEYTDLYEFIPPERHAEFTRRATHDWPSVKSVCNRLQDAARALRMEQEMEPERSW